MKRDAGQSLLELVLGLALSALVVLGAAGLFRDQWKQAQCAFWVFEETHARLVGMASPLRQRPVMVTEGHDSFLGRGLCGSGKESVELRKLESWNRTGLR